MTKRSLALLILVPSVSYADWKDFQVHGFLSQGYLYTTHNEFFGHSTNKGSVDLTEIGLNGAWQPFDDTRLVVQGMYRHAGVTDNQGVRLDFGYLDQTLINTDEFRTGIRLGRVVNPYGFYNDTRDMPFTRLGILLPQSIYFDVDRQLALSADGGQYYAELNTDVGNFTLQYNLAYPRVNDPTFQHIFAPVGKMISDLSMGGRLTYDYKFLTLAVTGAEVHSHYAPPYPAYPLKNGDFTFPPIIFSSRLSTEHFILDSEYAIRPTSLHNFGFPNQDTTGESWYVQGTYLITEHLSMFARYDELYNNVSDRNGKKFGAPGKPYGQFAKDITFGAGYLFLDDSMMIRLEYHDVNGTAWLSNLDNKNEVQHWRLFAASISFRF